DSDHALRLKTSLNTSNGYYDEVIALSQKIVNKDFETVYDHNPDMKNVYYSSMLLGTINATVAAPKMILGSAVSSFDANSITYLMNFTSGTISGDWLEEDLNITGWKLALQVDLTTQVVGPDTPLTGDRKKDKKIIADNAELAKARVWAAKFNTPGDYTIERLLANLTDAKWNDFNNNLSYFGVDEDGNDIAWSDLITKHPDLEINLHLFFSKWAKAQQENGLTTLGWKFTAPPTPGPVTALTPTFIPTARFTQIFGYKNPFYGVNALTPGDNETGGLNSLLYCEMVGNHPLPGNGVAGGLILASPGTFTCHEQDISGKGRIDGTFALSHQLFLEQFLLPLLQPLNKASEVYPTTASVSHNSEKNATRIEWNYSAGVDPNHLDYRDTVFQFIPQGHDLKNPKSYHFNKENRVDIGIQKDPQANVWATFKTVGNAEVSVSWTPGGTTLNITGVTDYGYDAEWADNAEMLRPNSWLMDTFRFQWAISISIVSVTGGVMKLSLDAGANKDGNVSVITTLHKQQNSETPANQDTEIKNYIAGRLRDQISTLYKNLQNSFQTTTKFIYPGNGTFDFSNAMFGETGEVLAEILQDPTNPTYKETNTVIHAVTPVAKLTWAASSATFQAKGQSITVSITGTNKTTAPIEITNVTFSFASDPKGRRVFT
ncbi:hypothetical protein BGZ60DRAFT_335081, partial [Tricladium varicosporioides]